MKKLIFTIIILFSLNQNLFSQHFDSSYTIASSPEYNYKNPVFEKSSNIFSFSFDYMTLAYEKWDTLNSKSNIVFRKVLFNTLEPEVLVTSDNFLNTNPSAGHTIIVWQSNKNSNIDIFYSTYVVDSGWTVPLALQNTPEYELNPAVAEIKLGSIPPAYYIVYQANGEVYLKILYQGNFLLDTNLTANINEACNNPKIKISSSNLYISYLNSVNSIQRIVILRGKIANNYTLNWQSANEIIQSNSVSEIKFTNGGNFAEGFLTYNYDTLNTSHSLGISLFDLEKNVFTKNYSGRNFNGAGSIFPIITNNISDNFYFSAFGWLRKSNDSSIIMANGRFYGGFAQYSSKFYIGDSSVSSKLDMSDFIFNNLYEVMFRLVWEKKINNRTALLESKFKDYLDKVKFNGEKANNYYLNQNYPNPFNPGTKINFSIPKNSFVTLKVYDMLGKEVAALVNENLNPGSYNFDFNAAGFASGIYFYKITAGDFSEVKKMTLLK